MAIYHFSAKPVSRSAGRSATASAAYRAGEKILDTRTGEIHDYTRRSGVESADIVLPDGAPEWATDRAALWNAAELAEKRKDACVAREFEVALPAELSPEQRRRLALDFAQDMANREGCAVDVAIHAPGKEGDNRNWHAHILRTTRKVGPDGLGAKLDTEQAGRKRKDDLEQVRESWASMTNSALESAGHTTRVSHLSLEAQGIDRDAGIHLGPAASAIERRGEVSDKTRNHQERQREAAGKVAAMVAIAEAQARAAEQARAQAVNAAELARAAAQVQAQQQADQAEAQAAAQQAHREAAAAQAQAARDAADQEQLKEKEDDRVRDTALAALAKSSRATGRAITFAVADHASIGRDVQTAKGSVLAARDANRASNVIAANHGGRVESAVEGAERRVARSHLESSAPAVKQQLGTVNRVVQQAVGFFPAVVRAIAAAAKEVTQQLQKAAAKASERPTAAAPAPAKAIPTPAPEKPPAPVLVDTSAFDKTGLRRSDDLDLVKRAKELFAQPKPDGYARYMLSQDLSKAMSAAVREINATEPQASAVDAERTIKTEQNTAARSAGQPEPWKAEQTACAWDTIAFRLDRERREHLETKRPSGMFSGAAGKEYDAKTASLTSQIDNITRAAVTLKAELQAKLAEKAQEAAQRGPQHAAAKERHEGLTRLHKAVGEAVKQIEANEPQVEHSKSNDFGR